MTPERLRLLLDSPESAESWLRKLSVRDTPRGRENVERIARLDLDPSLLVQFFEQLERLLPAAADPDRALNNLERFLDGCGDSDTKSAICRDPQSIAQLVQLFSASQSFSEALITDPKLIETLRVGAQAARRSDELRARLEAELHALPEGEARLTAIRRFRQAELLCIGFRDVVRDLPLEVITHEISQLADAVVSAALTLATEKMSERYGIPRRPDGSEGRLVVLAMGKLGGEELNYSSDIDLILIYDDEAWTDGRRAITAEEFWGKVSTELIRSLTAHTDRGQAYRVDLRLRPEGEHGPIARSLASTLAYYDSLGRTWERQALIKARPIAGHTPLGEEFLRRINPFVFRKYLTFAEINEIKAMKRRIEAKSEQAGYHRAADEREPEHLDETVSFAPKQMGPFDVKTGRGGIRDIEFIVQFLQLLNGAELPAVQERNTIRALAALERAGCLHTQERLLLEENYRFLRKVEHRLQILFDLQTHTVPTSKDELEKLARRLGYQPAGARHATSAHSRFLSELKAKTQLNQRILDHLLHQAFRDEPTQPETDLVLDPRPNEETIQRVLGRYHFRDPLAAYRSLVALAVEPVPFLSSRRCRHFLASIAPQLLRELAETPDPDMALVNLEKITASLGARGVLWELFSFSSPSLTLCVELCAWSQFLSQILINNPGMIDDLMDSLVLNQPRSIDELQAELAELCRAAEDPEPILHSFKDKELLRIGVRDILGKDSLLETTHALSEVAEVVLRQIVEHEHGVLAEEWGDPIVESGPRAGQPSRWSVVAMGKFGGQELSYHGDLDVIFVYEGDGQTRLRGRRRGWEPTSNFHFFSELAQRIIRAAGGMGPQGRLYSIDPRLRPTGRSGGLVIPLDQFARYHESGAAALWERQTLTKARLVFGESDFCQSVAAAMEHFAYGTPWQPQMADEIFSVRRRLEDAGTKLDLKRGFGGIVDIEFIVQLLQLKHGPTNPSVRTPNTWLAMQRLRDAGFLDSYNHSFLRTSYDYLRRVESRLRIVHNVSRDELPADRDDLEKLARRLGYQTREQRSASDDFLQECDRITAETRQTFLRILDTSREMDS